MLPFLRPPFAAGEAKSVREGANAKKSIALTTMQQRGGVSEGQCSGLLIPFLFLVPNPPPSSSLGTDQGGRKRERTSERARIPSSLPLLSSSCQSLSK